MHAQLHTDFNLFRCYLLTFSYQFHSLFRYTLADNDMCMSVTDLYNYRVHMESLPTRQSLEFKNDTIR